MNDQRTILVRYNEIGLKGGNRKYFEKILLKNIKRVLPDDEGIYTELQEEELCWIFLNPLQMLVLIN